MNRKTKDWITAYLEYTDNEEPPRLYQKWAAISAISACLQRKCWIKKGKLLWYPNLYVFLVGPSSARKGTAMRTVIKLLDSVSGEVSFTPTRSTDAEIIQVLGRSRKIVTFDDGTVYEHCSATIFNEEMTVLIGSKSETMMEFLTDWYDCGSKWENRTKTSGSDNLSNVFVSLLGATTPKKFASLPKAQAEGGLFARSIIVYGDKKHRLNPCPEMSEKHITLFNALEHDLQAICSLKGEFIQDKDAIAAYDSWYIEQGESPPFTDDLLGPYSDRRGMNVSKLSMIMSASRTDSRIITINDFMSAKKALEEVEVLMPYAFGGIGDNRLAYVQSQIERVILAAEAPISASGLMRHFRNNISYDDMAKVLMTLKDSGLITIEVDDNGKRFIKKR